MTLIKDKKDRTWATMGDGQALNEKVIRGHKGQLNKDLTGTVTQVRLVGTTIITPEGYKLFLHPSGANVRTNTWGRNYRSCDWSSS